MSEGFGACVRSRHFGFAPRCESRADHGVFKGAKLEKRRERNAGLLETAGCCLSRRCKDSASEIGVRVGRTSTADRRARRAVGIQ